MADLAARRPHSSAQVVGLPSARRGLVSALTCASIEFALIFSFSCSILLRFLQLRGFDLRDAGDARAR